jgi:hypothetical protein
MRRIEGMGVWEFIVMQLKAEMVIMAVAAPVIIFISAIIHWAMGRKG